MFNWIVVSNFWQIIKKNSGFNGNTVKSLIILTTLNGNDRKFNVIGLSLPSAAEATCRLCIHKLYFISYAKKWLLIIIIINKYVKKTSWECFLYLYVSRAVFFLILHLIMITVQNTRRNYFKLYILFPPERPS